MQSPDIKQLPALISLADEDSPESRELVRLALEAYGPKLKNELAKLKTAPTDSQRQALQQIMQDASRKELEELWPQWQLPQGELLRLESGLAMISEFLSGYEFPEGLKTLLDRLADAYSVHSSAPGAVDLASYLFQHLQFKGEDLNYYHPRNSDLCQVIHSRRGNPISLVSIFMLVGQRMDLKIDGVNFPGHFLARTQISGEIKLIDCFNGGKIVDHKVVAAMSEQTPWGVQAALQSAADTSMMLTRVLSNLRRSFQELSQSQNAEMISRLLNTMTPQKEAQAKSDLNSKTLSPKFHTGQLVRHRHYGYRAVIVDFDMACMADDNWYRKNRSQPERKQPWYHLFVDQSDQVTYAAQSNLIADESNEEIFHPWVPRYFDRFIDGRYIRNQIPWDGL